MCNFTQILRSSGRQLVPRDVNIYFLQTYVLLSKITYGLKFTHLDTDVRNRLSLSSNPQLDKLSINISNALILSS